MDGRYASFVVKKSTVGSPTSYELYIRDTKNNTTTLAAPNYVMEAAFTYDFSRVYYTAYNSTGAYNLYTATDYL